MYKIKAIAQRGALFSAAAVIAVAAYMPAPSASADALNPLTDRSLTLSSSSPGWSFTDGSGNTTYAPPNSGANGQKTGNTFDFKVSTDTSGIGDELEAITFQYCTTSAGNCISPGDNGYTGTSPSATRNGDSASTTDLKVVTATPTEVTNFSTIVNAVDGEVQAIPSADNSQGNFIVYYESTPGTWLQSEDWDMAATNKETGTVAEAAGTGQENFITLTNTAGQGFEAGTRVKVVFFGTNTNYITNPGSKEFFVKINTYNDDTTLDDTTLVDGGVTVANVMNHSISIQTKVLETMEFSVGTVDPNTLESGSAAELFDANGKVEHGVCDRILTGMKPADPVNVLKMGNQDGEDSLETDTTYSTHSYWRLSSNSSAGATVYYSGITLSNTVADQITAIGPVAAAPSVGTEQFGLAIANSTSGNALVDYTVEDDAGQVYENGADATTNGIHATMGTDPAGSNPSYHAPQLLPLVAGGEYNSGAGIVNTDYGTINTAFAFDNTSNTIPVPIATENNQVVDCVTAKMRYVANIAATTPAGIYTTKVNYIASPQY